MNEWFDALSALVAVPRYSLPALFAVSFLSSTLLPLGSEALLVALLARQPELAWPALLVATAGNTLGGWLTWWMGRGAAQAWGARSVGQRDLRSQRWLTRFGPKACLLSWLPVVGDPLCAAAGWLRLPFGQCAAYILVGKLLRYAVLTAFLVGV